MISNINAASVQLTKKQLPQLIDWLHYLRKHYIVTSKLITTKNM